MVDAGLSEINVMVQEVKIMEEQDTRKTTDSDEVSNWILNECSQQLAKKIHRVVIHSLKEGKIPMD